MVELFVLFLCLFRLPFLTFPFILWWSAMGYFSFIFLFLLIFPILTLSLSYTKLLNSPWWVKCGQELCGTRGGPHNTVR